MTVLFHVSKTHTKQQQQERIRQLQRPEYRVWLFPYTSLNEILFSEGKNNFIISV